MKIMTCPLNGPRNISEFICTGEVSIEPDPNRCTNEEWADYVFLLDNEAGVVREWWCHVPTAFWFIAERDTLTDDIKRTYLASELFSERKEYSKPEVEAAT
jgi:sarcosine oxidase subunit delta